MRHPLGAAIVILHIWRAVRWLRWANAAARDAVRFHTFSHRTRLNLETVCPELLGRGLLGLSKLRRRRCFFDYGTFKTDAAKCRFCQEASIDAVVFYSLGGKMTTSTPFLVFGCGKCLHGFQSIEFQRHNKDLCISCDSEEFYHVPQISRLSNWGCRTPRWMMI